MDIAKLAIEKKIVTIVLTIAMFGGGIIAFDKLGRLEDPEFTIKQALVITNYPGATAEEVEEEVSDKIEKAVQQLSQLKEVYSQSDRGRSIVTVTIEDTYDKDTLPQVWDEVRRKVSDVQAYLPPGAGPSMVVDDYGDVYGIFLAIYGSEYSYAELYEFAKLLQRELLLVDDVAKVELGNLRQEAIIIEPHRDRMAQLGIPDSVIINLLQAKNIVANGGMFKAGREHIYVEPTGTFSTVEQFGSLLIASSQSDTQIYLKDIADIRRDYVDPPSNLLRYDGHTAISLGISTKSGGNVVTMGEAVQQRLTELEDQTPLGVQIESISFQSDAVTESIDGFLINLYQAVGIVIIVLMFFMGLRSGVLIGFSLMLTILGTFILMQLGGITLERISLGALVIALGMLVDNAIVVVDGILVRTQQGMSRNAAASETVQKTMWPLFGATAVAILAFASIGLSDDATGEICGSLFYVILYSLSLSWIVAITVVPLMAVSFLEEPKVQTGDVYDTKFYNLYKGFLRGCIDRRWATLGVILILFFLSLKGFGYIDRTFFPDSSRPQFLVDYMLPEGTHIEETTRQAAEIEKYLLELDHVTHITTLVGEGAMRFMLTYAPQKANSSYCQFLVDVDDYKIIDGLRQEIEDYLYQNHPDGLARSEKFSFGPPGSKIEVKLKGPDANVLRKMASQTEQIMRETGMAKGIRTDWRQKAKAVKVVVAEEQANLNGITEPDIARVLQQAYEGVTVGIFRDGDLLLPIVMRASQEERASIDSLKNIQIWSPKAGKMIPIRQVVKSFETDYVDARIFRFDRQRQLSVTCDPQVGVITSNLQNRLLEDIKDLELPPGYTFEWGGEYDQSSEANSKLMGKLPPIILMMIIIVIILFNSIRQPLVIWACVPLALIGVAGGLLLTGQSFGFMSLLGFLSLMGMLIKNAIVLIDQINLELTSGMKTMEAIISSGVSRLRPVSMAAATTMLGMLPLIKDPFFVSMAVTIIGGLLMATVLTMIFVPVLYAIVYNVKE